MESHKSTICGCLRSNCIKRKTGFPVFITFIHFQGYGHSVATFKMMIVVGVAFLLCLVDASMVPKAVKPEFLDELLREGRYEEFSHYLGIPDPNLVVPSEERSPDLDPRFTRGLVEGDMILTDNWIEQTRQGVNFNRYGGSRWPNAKNEPAYIPVSFASNFTEEERVKIINGLAYWNENVKSIQIVYYNGQRDYIFIFPGDGCWSHIGRRYNQQAFSLGPGCVYQGTVVHEMEHAIGMAHEQNREDRDNYVEMLWDNIPPKWRDQYDRTDPNVYNLIGRYDYYSIMHYPVTAPETRKPAFRVKYPGYDEKLIGNGDEFTAQDIEKINTLYS